MSCGLIVSMHKRSVIAALSQRQFFRQGLSYAALARYDAATMSGLRRRHSFAIAALAAACGALGAQASAEPALRDISLTVVRVVGSEALLVNGESGLARPVEAALYATYSRDIPTVLLSRRILRVAADGTFTATLPVAPAFFRGAILTVVVRSMPGGRAASASIAVAAPNGEAPPDTLPPSVR